MNFLQTKGKGKKMIRHAVMFTFSDTEGLEAKKANIEAAKERTLALKDKVDFLRNIEVRVNTNYDDKRNYDYIIFTDFDCIEDIQRYVDHPEHIKVAQFTGQFKVARACVDFELGI